MATAEKVVPEIKFEVSDGPNLHQLMFSLMRKPRFFWFESKTEEATSVHFAGPKQRKDKSTFCQALEANITAMIRLDDPMDSIHLDKYSFLSTSCNRWNIQGYYFVPDIEVSKQKTIKGYVQGTFEGVYELRTRKGIFTLRQKSK